jgi:hypothetical protein
VADLVTEVRTKSKVLDQLRSLLGDEDSHQQTLRTAAPTRWDSTGYMLASVFNARGALQKIQEEDTIKKIPDMSDQNTLRMLRHLDV